MPASINSTEYKGRPACTNCGWCHAGCAIGAMATPLVGHLREARKRGAEVRPFSYVTRVLTNPSGDRVTGVEYYDGKSEQHVQPAGAVVLAAYSAENPRIMLNSATDKHPKGLANKNELVGKYLMCHALSTAWAMFDEDVQNHMGTAAYQFMSYERYDKTHAKKGFGSTFIRTGSAMKPKRPPGVAARSVRAAARRLHEARGARAHPHRQFRRGDAARREPRRAVQREGRVRHADRAHHPRVRPGDGRLLGLGTRRGVRDRQGGQAEGSLEGGGAAPGSSHLLGGTIMGTDAGNSVTNSYGQTHELANLYLAGGGLFPTEGASIRPTR